MVTLIQSVNVEISRCLQFRRIFNPTGRPKHQATDADGQSVQSSFAISVHRPIEIFYNGNLSIAEVMAPVPVSGCLPGGEARRSVVYSEAMQETRSRSYNVSWNEQWLSSRTVSLGSQQTVGLSETNGVGFRRPTVSHSIGP